MRTPYEDIEYLSDLLPDEGEMVLLTRRGGELHCEPFRPPPAPTTSRDGISETELYGRLVQVNERLNGIGTASIWAGVLAAFWMCVLFHQLTTMGWHGWYFDTGICLMVITAWMVWVQMRTRFLFRAEVRPMLESQLRRRSLQKHGLIAAVRQHPELKTVLAQLAEWTD